MHVNIQVIMLHVEIVHHGKVNGTNKNIFSISCNYLGRLYKKYVNK